MPEDPLEEFYRQHPELRPGAAAGGAVGNIFSGGTPKAPAGGGKPSPNAPSGPPPLPAGYVPSPTPGRGVRQDGFAIVQLNPQTNQWDVVPGFTPSAAELQAAGINRGSGSGYVQRDYNAENRAQQLAGGGKAAPEPTWHVFAGDVRAVDKNTGIVYTKNPETGVWTTFGNRATADDKAAFSRDVAAQGRSAGGAISPTAPTGSTTALDTLSTLAPNQGPTFRSSLFSQGVEPGRSLPYTEGMLKGGNAATSALNNLTVQSRSMQGSGPVVQGLASAYPNGLIEFTRGGQGTTRTVSPGRAFDALQFYVPSTYDPGPGPNAGMNRDTGTFNPVDVGYNISAPDLLSGTPGGAGVMTLSGPQTAHINDMSTGFNPNAVAASNIGLAYGRDFSSLDPVSQMVATAALMDQRDQLTAMGYSPQAALEAMTAADPGTWEGGGYRGFAKGGTVMTGRPLGMARPDLVTNEPIVGIGTMTGKTHFIVGEDNADRDRMPDPERLRFRGNSMQIIPLDPPRRRFDDGGRVDTEDESDFNLGTMAGYIQSELRGMSPEQLEAWFLMRDRNDYPDFHGDLTNAVPLPAYTPGDLLHGYREPLPGYGFTPPIVGPYLLAREIPQLIPQNNGDFWGPQGTSRPPAGFQQFASGGTVQYQQQGPPQVPSTMPMAALLWAAAMKGISSRPELEGGPPQGRVMSWYPGFAEGGTVATTNAFTGPGVLKTRPDGSMYYDLTGGGSDVGAPPVDESAPPIAAPPVAAPPVAAPPVAAPPTPRYIEPPAIPMPLPTFNPLDESILSPWQKAAQDEAMRAAARNTYQYRRQAAGLGRENAIPVLQGTPTAAPPPPGSFYDFTPQIEKAVTDITGRQRDIRALGELEDTSPVQNRLTFVGRALDDLDRIRALEDAKVAAEAGGSVPSAGAGNIAAWQEQLSNLGGEMGTLISQPKETWTPSTYQYYNGLVDQMAELKALINTANQQGVTSLDKKSIIDAQIGAIRERLPEGVSEEGLRTELAGLQQRLSRNQKRIDLTNEVQNLSKIGVPNLSNRVAA